MSDRHRSLLSPFLHLLLLLLGLGSEGSMMRGGPGHCWWLGRSLGALRLATRRIGRLAFPCRCEESASSSESEDSNSSSSAAPAAGDFATVARLDEPAPGCDSGATSSATDSPSEEASSSTSADPTGCSGAFSRIGGNPFRCQKVYE